MSLLIIFSLLPLFFLIFRILILSNYLFIVSFTSSQLELEILLEGDQPSWAAKQMVKYLEKNAQCKNIFLLFDDLTIRYIEKKNFIILI